MKLKTSDLQGPDLDLAVAKAWQPVYSDKHLLEHAKDFHPSTDWAQGGPIIEREKVTIEWTGEDWMGYIRHDEEIFGPTPLIAAMRCYVAACLGDEIELPEELK